MLRLDTSIYNSKILGEVQGGLVNQLSMEMTSNIIGKEIFGMIRNAEKKTILFKSYIDTITLAEQLCIQSKFKPLVITGANTKEAKDILDKFRTAVYTSNLEFLSKICLLDKLL